MAIRAALCAACLGDARCVSHRIVAYRAAPHAHRLVLARIGFDRVVSHRAVRCRVALRRVASGRAWSRIVAPRRGFARCALCVVCAMCDVASLGVIDASCVMRCVCVCVCVCVTLVAQRAWRVVQRVVCCV